MTNNLPAVTEQVTFLGYKVVSGQTVAVLTHSYGDEWPIDRRNLVIRIANLKADGLDASVSEKILAGWPSTA